MTKYLALKSTNRLNSSRASSPRPSSPVHTKLGEPTRPCRISSCFHRITLHWLLLFKRCSNWAIINPWDQNTSLIGNLSVICQICVERYALENRMVHYNEYCPNSNMKRYDFPRIQVKNRDGGNFGDVIKDRCDNNSIVANNAFIRAWFDNGRRRPCL